MYTYKTDKLKHKIENKELKGEKLTAVPQGSYSFAIEPGPSMNEVSNIQQTTHTFVVNVFLLVLAVHGRS